MNRKNNKLFDELDYLIMLELHSDARMPAADIARKVGANERTVRKRIEWLIETKTIRPTVIVDPDAFNYVNATDIFLEVDPKSEQGIIEQLLSIQNISYLAYGQGTGEISLEARFKDNEELRNFLSFTLPSIPNLRVKGYALVPRMLKNIDDWLPRKEDFDIS